MLLPFPDAISQSITKLMREMKEKEPEPESPGLWQDDTGVEPEQHQLSDDEDESDFVGDQTRGETLSFPFLVPNIQLNRATVLSFNPQGRIFWYNPQTVITLASFLLVVACFATCFSLPSAGVTALFDVSVSWMPLTTLKLDGKEKKT